MGDFDERIFLGEDAEEEIGTPGGQRVANLSDEMHRRSLKQHVEEVSSLCVCAYVRCICLCVCMLAIVWCVCICVHVFYVNVFVYTCTFM